MADKASTKLQIEKIVNDVLATIEREREREIVSRRFGLFDRKETLEQIGELLGITRERLRHLEKAVVTRLRQAANEGKLPHITEVQEAFIAELDNLGHIARVPELAGKITEENTRLDQARVAFLAELSPDLIVISDNDHYHHAVGKGSKHDDKQAVALVDDVVNAIKKIAEPIEIEPIAKEAKIEENAHAAALASVSKNLATLNNRWGLIKWPTVNPKNIRDKIYVILKEQGKHMHFSEISEAIKGSSFKRKDVTTQAIHNELIKDKRFVLIGRGIYALKEWGYKKGTVADIITEVLQKAGEPLHRDEIVKRVLKSRYVKETTILLNLQGKQQFKRVAKATYTLAD